MAEDAGVRRATVDDAGHIAGLHGRMAMVSDAMVGGLVRCYDAWLRMDNYYAWVASDGMFGFLVYDEPLVGKRQAICGAMYAESSETAMSLWRCAIEKARALGVEEIILEARGRTSVKRWERKGFVVERQIMRRVLRRGIYG